MDFRAVQIFQKETPPPPEKLKMDKPVIPEKEHLREGNIQTARSNQGRAR